MPRYLVVKMLPYSKEVENIYIINAENENDAHQQKIPFGSIGIIKNLDTEPLPLKIFRTFDEPEER